MGKREIELRVWDRENNKFNYFTLGNIMCYGDIFQKHVINGDHFEQFTGLKDKNGKDIYENDKVINNNGKEREVGFNERRCQFGLYSRQLDCWVTNELINDTWEVKGHIHG